MYSDSNSFSQNGHKSPDNSGRAIHVGIDGQLIPDRDREHRQDIAGLHYTQKPTPKVEAKIFIAILFSVGLSSGLLAVFLNIAAWEAHLFSIIAIASTISALIWKWVDKVKAWRLKDIETKLRQKELDEIHF